MPKLTCEHLTFSYPGGTPVLKGINFSISQGEYVTVVGANGSGKSTLGRHLNGLLLPQKGRVTAGDYSTAFPEDIPNIRRTVGMVFQMPETQIVGTTVETDIAFALENIGIPKKEIRSRITAALKAVDLAGFEERPTGQLSGGEQQRLALGCMIALDPDILVFDEATSMIEPEGRKKVLGIMKELHESGKTIVSITHDMDEASRAQRILHFHRGELIHDLPPEDFFSISDLESFNLAYPRVQTAANYIKSTVSGFQYSGKNEQDFIHTLRSYLSRHRNGNTTHRVQTGEPGTSPVISFDKVSFSYLKGTEREQRGLEDISLAIRENEITAVVGKTGSGKSTLLQHINALILPCTGSVHTRGVNTSDPKADLRSLRMNCGFAFQRPEKQLFKTFTGDDIAFALQGRDLTPTEKGALVKKAMMKTGLSYSGFKDRPVFALSGGERRKAALSGIFVHEPDILILDEPTSGLDPVSAAEIMNTIRREHESGRTIIFATHDLEVVSELAGRVIQMEDGRVIFDGSTGNFFKKSAGSTDRDLLPVAVRASLDEGISAAGVCGWNNRELGISVREAVK